MKATLVAVLASVALVLALAWAVVEWSGGQ